MNRYTKNFFISSLPGLVSIFLSFFSIPIYLKNLGYEEYGNFLILHILLSITMITNFNLGKIASVRLQKVNNLKCKEIIFTTILLSFISSGIVTIIIYYLVNFLLIKFNLTFFENNILFYYSLFIANIYVTLENLCKGKGFFKLSSISNLIFYSLSISIPSLLLINGNSNFSNGNELFKISFYFKLSGFLLLIAFLFYKNLVNFNKISKIILTDFKIYSKWQTLSSLYMQIFDFLDKYIIKIILGSSFLSIYSIPQQIAGKLSIVSDSLISVFLPRISSIKSKKRKYEILNSNFYGFFYLIGLALLIILPFLNKLIYWWLGENTNPQIVYLFKIFIVISFYISLTHIISTYLDSNFQSKKNFQIDTWILILFLIGIIFCIYSKDINYFAYIVLIKSITAFFIKIRYLNKEIINYKVLVFQNFLFLIICYFHIQEKNSLYILFIIFYLLVFIKKFPLKFLKKEFF